MGIRGSPLVLKRFVDGAEGEAQRRLDEQWPGKAGVGPPKSV